MFRHLDIPTVEHLDTPNSQHVRKHVRTTLGTRRLPPALVIVKMQARFGVALGASMTSAGAER